MLAEFGIRYVCDWVNDEQPYPLKVPQGELYALPIALPLDDVNALWDRRIDIDRYREMIKETFDMLMTKGPQTGGCWCCICTPGSWASLSASATWTRRWAISCSTRACGPPLAPEIIDWYRHHRPGV